MRIRTTFAAVIAAAAAAGPALASPDVVADMAGKAMDRGHGATCSLAMVPVPSGGYYPCLDFGPYRVVREYGRVSGYVVAKDKVPFRVMVVDQAGARFTVSGPWEQDMAARVVIFWNDVVEGGAADRDAKLKESRERSEAEAYVRDLMKGPEEAAKAQPAAPTAPSPAPAAPAPGASAPATAPVEPSERAILDAIGR